MRTFHYVAIDPDGRRLTGDVNAADEVAARRVLSRRKLLPVQLRTDGRPAAEAGEAAPRAASSSQTLGHRAQLLLTRQLATLIDAAVPVDEALSMVAAQQESPAVSRVLRGVHTGVLEGLRLSDALGLYPRAFSPLYRATVAGGERAGNLGPMLTRLGEHMARVDAMRTKVTTAMIYPAALSVIAVLVVSCLMIFVVPPLAEQFRSFDAKLPLATEVLIAVSSFLSTYWLFLLAGGALAALAVGRLMRIEAVREGLDAWTLRAPLIGRWASAISASRFIRAVSTLVASGTPVLDSVRIARSAVGNRAATRAITRMATAIEEGEPLSIAMRRSGFVPPLVTYMAASGENAGDLPGMLEKAADYLDQEFEAFSAAAISLLEPAIIVFMGVIVAGIILAIMLPVLQLNTLTMG